MPVRWDAAKTRAANVTDPFCLSAAERSGTSMSARYAAMRGASPVDPGVAEPEPEVATAERGRGQRPVGAHVGAIEHGAVDTERPGDAVHLGDQRGELEEFVHREFPALASLPQLREPHLLAELGLRELARKESACVVRPAVRLVGPGALGPVAAALLVGDEPAIDLPGPDAGVTGRTAPVVGLRVVPTVVADLHVPRPPRSATSAGATPLQPFRLRSRTGPLRPEAFPGQRIGTLGRPLKDFRRSPRSRACSAAGQPAVRRPPSILAIRTDASRQHQPDRHQHTRPPAASAGRWPR